MAQTAAPERSDPPKTKIEAAPEMSKEQLDKIREKQLDKLWPYVGN
jgi:hypothetical protein